MLHRLPLCNAYYLRDTEEYYYNAKFKVYTETEDTWSDIDEVCYGRIGKFHYSWEDGLIDIEFDILP